MTIFNESVEHRRATAQAPEHVAVIDIPKHLLRAVPPVLPQVSELQTIRHFTCLSRKNFAIDTQFYPLGSCTMKYNPRAAHHLASQAAVLKRHPLSSLKDSQGFLECLYELQQYLQIITGMHEVSLTPMAGAQGEYAGVAMIKAFHESRNDIHRTEILIPETAHGTNPASAVMCGYRVREITTLPDGDIDIENLKTHLGPQTAGIMLTNPSTLGVFERKVREVADLVHHAGGLLYYDGANLNAILGKVRPFEMGFDVVHLNLHKTFATPHGGGGPGAGPVAAAKNLAPFLPVPMIGKKDGIYYWVEEKDRPQSIGRLSTFMGNAGVLLRAYIYIRMLGKQGLIRVSEFATLNANYLLKRLQDVGFTAAYPNRLATHEFIITVKKLAKQHNVTALDFAKRLLDYGFHAPTIYFPLLVPECMLIEPTETECKQELDNFVAAMEKILNEAQNQPELVQTAPHTMPVKRLDEVKAARELNVIWKSLPLEKEG